MNVSKEDALKANKWQGESEGRKMHPFSIRKLDTGSRVFSSLLALRHTDAQLICDFSMQVESSVSQ